MRALALAALLSFTAASLSAQINQALLVDPPVDVHAPAHDIQIADGTLLLPAGASAHPAVILLTSASQPLQEDDLGQSLRRAGWIVLLAKPGSTPAFSVFAMANATPRPDDLPAMPLFSADMNRTAVVAFGPAASSLASYSAAEVVLVSPASLPAASWFGTRPTLFFSAEDGTQSPCEAIMIALKAAKTATKSVHIHMRTDAQYASRRIALQSAIVDWLARP